MLWQSILSLGKTSKDIRINRYESKLAATWSYINPVVRSTRFSPMLESSLWRDKCLLSYSTSAVQNSLQFSTESSVEQLCWVMQEWYAERRFFVARLKNTSGLIDQPSIPIILEIGGAGKSRDSSIIHDKRDKRYSMSRSHGQFISTWKLCLHSLDGTMTITSHHLEYA